MSSCWFVRKHISIGEFLKYTWSLPPKCRLCVKKGFYCNGEDGVCTLISVLDFFIVQDLNFLLHLITFESIRVIFYELFSLNIQGDVRYFHNKSWCRNFYFRCSLLVMMRVQRVKKPNRIPSRLVQTHQRKQRSHHTLDVQDQWNVCVLSIIVQFFTLFKILVASTCSLLLPIHSFTVLYTPHTSHISFLIVASWRLLIPRKRVLQWISSFCNWLFTLPEYDWKHL